MTAESHRLDLDAKTSDIASRYAFRSRSLPSGDTSSPEAFHCLKGWIDDCIHHHQRCRNVVTQWKPPKRILEIKRRRVFLRETPMASINYACLSHCWGPDGVPFKLTNANLSSMQAGLAFSLLPKTFYDAVQVCVRLNITYLWIDALCE